MWGNYATYWMDNPLPGIQRSETPQVLRILHDTMMDLAFWEMEPANQLVSASEQKMGDGSFRTNFCLARVGSRYAVFCLFEGEVRLALERCTMRR